MEVDLYKVNRTRVHSAKGYHALVEMRNQIPFVVVQMTYERIVVIFIQIENLLGWATRLKNHKF